MGGGAIISGGHVERSLLGRGVRVNSYSRVSDSILMENVVVGRYAKLRNCIIDKNVVIPEGMEIGFDLVKDRRLFTVSANGIVVVPKNCDLTGLEPPAETSAAED